jgi:hypothetical protein
MGSNLDIVLSRKFVRLFILDDQKSLTFMFLAIISSFYCRLNDSRSRLVPCGHDIPCKLKPWSGKPAVTSMKCTCYSGLTNFPYALGRFVRPSGETDEYMN